MFPLGKWFEVRSELAEMQLLVDHFENFSNDASCTEKMCLLIAAGRSHQNG